MKAKNRNKKPFQLPHLLGAKALALDGAKALLGGGPKTLGLEIEAGVGRMTAQFGKWRGKKRTVTWVAQEITILARDFAAKHCFPSQSTRY